MNLSGTTYALIIQYLATQTFAIPTVQIADEYVTLFKLCSEGAKDTYVAVLYINGDRLTYKYGECYPYSIGASQAVQAVFCKPAFCVGKSNADCSGRTFPLKGVSVPVPPATTLVNPFEFVKVTGNAALCDEMQKTVL